ncbi:hypothetical protein CPC08DRAFT_694740 [Agrocybe pediades]|nr:hypothetical protein CPC08DRAFT_694740 [Agrocybe pediades]
MVRQLRPRTSRPSYAVMAGLTFGSEDENENSKPGPSSIAVLEDEVDSESDFAPEDDTRSQDAEGEPDDEEDEIQDDAEAEEDEDFADDDIVVKQPSAKAQGKTKAKNEDSIPTPQIGPPAAKRQNYALPAPSVHHRHRAVPLYSRDGRVERLLSRPQLFQQPSSTLTNPQTENSKISDRVNKSWGYNIGPGPLWDLAEDRAWFKEAITTAPDVDTEAKRRPRVYADVQLRNGWEILSTGDAAPYLPTDDVTTEEGNLQPPPAVPCYFGSMKKGQTRQDVSMFESFPMTKYYDEAKSHVFDAGAPVWGLDWCPIHVDDRQARGFKQYLAVGPFPSHSHSPDIGQKVSRPSYACIQIWSLSQPRKQGKSRAKAPSVSASAILGEMKCEMVLCIDSGPAYELKWCPLPSHDLFDDSSPNKKLGLLAGTFEDGSFSVFVVPEPSQLESGKNKQQPIFVKLPQPIVRIELEDAACCAFDWANSEVIAIGTTNGSILVYDIGSVVKAAAAGDQPTVTDLLPTHFLAVHQSAIRALGWIKAPPTSSSGAPRVDLDPTVIASAGYDGMECLTDIREGRGAVMNRTRDVLNALAFSPFTGGPITLDHENTVKSYSASPSMLGRGHSLFEPQGPVWSVHASDYHPQLAIGSADGTCSTTNMLRSTRRGGSVPFFVYKIFQMDYNRNTKEYRMLDRFLPQESFDRPTATRASKTKKGADEEPKIPASTGAWPREVGIHRVVWNNGNGLASSCLLAAGSASGLCRVDVLWGRWVRDKPPYGGVEGIRMEDVDPDAMEVDSEDEESD